MPLEEEYMKLIYDADMDYYKYINGFQKNENPFDDEIKLKDEIKKDKCLFSDEPLPLNKPSL
jgi:hypothetical protein